MDHREKIWEQYLETWPLNKIESMTIEQYAMGNDNYENTFSHWIENVTKDLGNVGGIGGGSSFKHGIYYMSNPKKHSGKYKNDGNYAWISKYGNTAKEAFQKIKEILIAVIKAAQIDDLESIDQIEFYAPIKWKWAFLHSKKALFPIFTREALMAAAKSLGDKKPKNEYPYLFQFIKDKMDKDASPFTIAEKVWQEHKKIKNPPSFKDIIADLQESFKQEDSILNKFSFHKAKFTNSYVWIIDDKKIIGELTAHYEIGINKTKDKLQIYLHFESDVQSEKDIFHQSYGSPLPDAFKWFDWRKSKSIRMKDEVLINDPNLISQLKEKLLFMDQSIGDRIRSIIVNNPTFKSIGMNGKENTENHFPLNQIMYGPPGTGKTFHTINKTLAIIEGEREELISKEARDNLKKRFEKLRGKGQIIFTTFHQSMSYEDFIEGIKPQEPTEGSGQLTYKVEAGAFVKICALAAFEYYLAKQESSKNKSPEVVDFDLLYDTYVGEIEQRMSNNETVEFFTKNNKPVVVKRINRNNSIVIVSKHSVRKREPVPKTKKNLRILYEKYNSADEINYVSDIKEDIGVQPGSSGYWALFNDLKRFEKENYPQFAVSIEEDELEYDVDQKIEAFRDGYFNDSIRNDVQVPKYVLIIDEINRGNISAIFGELITLLEKDKRLGNKESILLELPYSKKEFGVPPNLYIIGTMNTADRSVEALDTALRRRFHFLEMLPRPEVIKSQGSLPDGILTLENHSIDLAMVLTTINERIEILLDRDHLIGHSYFMDVKTLQDLKIAFAKNIIPLLQEYFYGDYGKISLVLGEIFCSSKKVGGNKFAIANHYDASAFDDKIIYTIPNIISPEFNIVNAIEILLNKKAVIEENA